MSAPQAIVALVERFDRHHTAYRSNRYNETQVRREFIDPLFEGLGWDIANRQGYAEAYKDVIHEDAIKVGGATKAPDYCFRLGGARKFFLEAKRPSTNLKEDPSPAFQLRRYAWSAKLPLSILTDFEELSVYDCRIQPIKSDTATTARLLYFTFSDYANRWDDIANIFSREALLAGSFDAYAESTKSRRGTLEVDAAFLKEIESWRAALARHLALRNPELTQRQLNYAVQTTIDRIIFLRICEDRGIEDYGQLMALLQGSEVYDRLCEHFRRADERYNSGLFHFQPEKGRAEWPDTLTLRLIIDDTPLKEMIRSIYYPDSPYEFSVLPATILGQVYEQFLGKVIRLTSGHHAVVEEKPEVRKAGGVYYTPAYVVEYIVRQTVGKLLAGKTLRQAARLKILDPACGSGSFLIGAYQYLLDWYRDQYTADGPAKHVKVLYQGSSGDWRLTTAERKRILLRHIYGVDIDPQAVEVTKLSLLLKVLEGENQQTLMTQLRLFQERALPDLGSNIKCGNSLIASDFYGTGAASPIDTEERYSINAFDWQPEFPAITKAGGFDVVIGNPPYLYSAGHTHADYFSRHYRLSQYQTDFYVFFIEKALALARPKGKVSFIVSDSWLNSEYFSKLRNHLLTHHRIDILAVFDYPVFEDATLENSIFIVTVSEKPMPIAITRFFNPTNVLPVNTINPQEAIERGIIDARHSVGAEQVIAMLERGASRLDTYVKLNRGIHAYRTDGYGKSKFGDGPQTKLDKDTRSYHADYPVDHTYLPELKGKHVNRFVCTPSGAFLAYGPWLAEPRTPELFFSPKIVLRKILGTKLHGTLLRDPVALDQSLYVLISKTNDLQELKYLLGILLSRLGAWYLRTKYAIYDTLYPWYTQKQLAAFPVKVKDAGVVQCVEELLVLHEQIRTAKTGQEHAVLRRQINVMETRLDELVYQVYGLTAEDIRMVETTHR